MAGETAEPTGGEAFPSTVRVILVALSIPLPARCTSSGTFCFLEGEYAHSSRGRKVGGCILREHSLLFVHLKKGMLSPMLEEQGPPNGAVAALLHRCIVATSIYQPLTHPASAADKALAGLRTKVPLTLCITSTCSAAETKLSLSSAPMHGAGEGSNVWAAAGGCCPGSRSCTRAHGHRCRVGSRGCDRQPQTFGSHRKD